MKYYDHGRPIYESTGKTNEKAAGRILRERLVRVDRGEPVMARLDRVPYTEAAKDASTTPRRAPGISRRPGGVCNTLTHSFSTTGWRASGPPT
jgi:hypothetical protein